MFICFTLSQFNKNKKQKCKICNTVPVYSILYKQYKNYYKLKPMMKCMKLA